MTSFEHVKVREAAALSVCLTVFLRLWGLILFCDHLGFYGERYENFNIR
ncbi:hypothetical protein [Campylobacter avium]|nr:hypothetical protein [Campylobacter avium]